VGSAPSQHLGEPAQPRHPRRSPSRGFGRAQPWSDRRGVVGPAGAAGRRSGARRAAGSPARGRFLPRDPRVGTFAPVPTEPLPFPAIVVASHNDPGSASTRRGVWRAAGVRGSRIWARPGISTPSRALAHGRRVRRGWTN
jgi:hypothetical protein